MAFLLGDITAKHQGVRFHLLICPFAATTFNIYYLKRNGPQNAPVKAFPPGLRVCMLRWFV